jgi:replicative DNA helicase
VTDFSSICNVEAEKSILGAILLNNTALNEAAGQINAADFSLDSHRRIFACMVDLAEASKPIDMVTLIEELNRTHDLVPVGDVSYVSSLIDGVPDRPSIQHYISIVKDYADRRSLLWTLERTSAQIRDGEATNDLVAGLQQAVLNVVEQSTRSRAALPREIIGGLLRDIETQSASEGLIGLPTGLSCLDVATGGLRPGELIVVGARPGAGKSALAGQIAIANAEIGNVLAFFSLEMSRLDLCRRFLSAVTDVPAYKLRDPRLMGAKKDDASNPLWRSLAAGAGKIAEWPILIDDNGSPTISEIIARAKLHIARDKAKLIIVDYLQLVRADAPDIRERVGRVADQLRILAKTEQVPVVLLSQLRRPQGINDEPTLIDLKESGDIEAHAHIVLLIHSPVGPDLRPAFEQKIIIAKNRNGLRGQVPVMLNDSKLLFYSRDLVERRQPPRGVVTLQQSAGLQ